MTHSIRCSPAALLPGALARAALAAMAALLALSAAHAKAPPDKIALLGEKLTPVGALQVGNDRGVAAWEGGLTSGSYSRGDNPFGDDKPLYTITSANRDKYKKMLTRTHWALFDQYPETYKMPVYRSRRSAAMPQRIYDATRSNAASVELTNDGNGFCCTAAGFPFPLPDNGTQVLWNHIMRFRPEGVAGYTNAARTAKNGDYVVQRSYNQAVVLYNRPGMTVDELGNQYAYVYTKVTAPASLAGDAYLIHLPLDRIKETTGVWIYNLGQGRVRRVSDIGYDNPLHDGLMTHDQVDMFNGPTDRYTVKLLGRKTMLVPYNAYALADRDLEYDDIVQTGHINQDLTRYEAHRMWVIDAQVRSDVSHIYAKRRFYVDEDTWTILVADMYDERGEFWRGAEMHLLMNPSVPTPSTAAQVHYDLQSRRYVVQSLRNEEKNEVDLDFDAKVKSFSPSGLKKFASRNYR